MASFGSSFADDLSGHVAIVTGANHGIGEATARALAASGAAVLLAFLRLDVKPAPGIASEYAPDRARTADAIVTEIRSSGGQAEAVETDLRAWLWHHACVG